MATKVFVIAKINMLHPLNNGYRKYVAIFAPMIIDAIKDIIPRTPKNVTQLFIELRSLLIFNITYNSSWSSFTLRRLR